MPDSHPTTGDASPRATRRTFLGGVASGAFAASLGGALGALFAETPAGAAVVSTAGTEALTGLLAYAVPGNDATPAARRVRRPARRRRPHAAPHARARRHPRRRPQHIAIPGISVTLPGGAAIAAWIDLTALVVSRRTGPGPFGSPFANLSWGAQGPRAEGDGDNRAYRGTPLCWVANQLSLLAAFTAFGEGGVRVGRTSQLTTQPVGGRSPGGTAHPTEPPNAAATTAAAPPPSAEEHADDDA